MDYIARINIAILGLPNVGKTCMLLSYVEGQCPDEYVPSIVDVSDMRKNMDTTPCLLNFYESQGSEDYARFRPDVYNLAHVIVCVFSVEYMSSYEALQNDLLIELQNSAPNTPILLVASKIDLRESPESIERMRAKFGHGPLTYEDGIALSEKLHAIKYYEICSKKLQGVNEVFDDAIRAALAARRSTKRKGGCEIM